MKGFYRQQRAARRDLIEIFQTIARRGGFQAARRFLARSEATFERLASLPNAGTTYDHGEARLTGLRYCPISRFKSYIVFYRPLPDGIEVLRVLHGSRDLEGILTHGLDDELEGEQAPEAE